jgi:hypothetical protein
MNIKKLNIKTLAWAFVPALLIGFSACGDDEPTQPTPTSPAPTTSTEQYILMDGLKVKIKNPANGTLIREQTGDSALSWSGNQPSTLYGDSILVIKHPVGVKRGTSTISDFATEYGEVGLTITYGETDSKTAVTITQGEYKLEKVNGIWYSVLKNGKAEGTKGRNNVTFTGVEFRLAWPSTFK